VGFRQIVRVRLFVFLIFLEPLLIGGLVLLGHVAVKEFLIKHFAHVLQLQVVDHVLKARVGFAAGRYFLVGRRGFLGLAGTGVACGDAVVSRFVIFGSLRVGVLLAFTRISIFHGILFIVLGSFAFVLGLPLLAIRLMRWVFGFGLGGVFAFVVGVLFGIAGV